MKALDSPGDNNLSPPTLSDDEIWRAIRRISKDDANLVICALLKTSLNFMELRGETGLDDNELNHALYDMMRLDLILRVGNKKGQRRYSLSEYCFACVQAIVLIKRTLNSEDNYEAATKQEN